MQISLLIPEEEVEHAIETQEGEVIVSWQTCASKIIFQRNIFL